MKMGGVLCMGNVSKLRVGATLAVARGVSTIERMDGSAQFRQVEGDRKGRPYIFVDKITPIPYTETIKGVADTGVTVSAWSSIRFSRGGPAMRRSSETLLHLCGRGSFFYTLPLNSKGEPL